jgi:superfamily II DNA/RNA helicase
MDEAAAEEGAVISVARGGEEGGEKERQKPQADDGRENGGGGVDFSGLLLSPAVVRGLTQAGYLRPSPIQLRAIPIARCGVGAPLIIVIMRFISIYFFLFQYK